MEIRKFVEEEVARQGHDLSDPEDGGVRVTWMLAAWDYARKCYEAGEKTPSVERVIEIAKMIEPEKNRDGIRTGDIWIGSGPGMDPSELSEHLEDLWAAMDRYLGDRDGVDEFYFEFERIHPFFDGNGRTGKVLNCWMLGVLDDPVLVKDFFGWGVP